MRNLLILIFTIIFFSLGTNCFAQKISNKKSNNTKNINTVNLVKNTNQWNEFVSTEGKFNVLFPENSVTKITDQGEGESRLRTVSQRVISPEVSFVVSFTDSFSNAKINDADSLEMLRDLIATNGKLIKQTKINQNGIEGWEIIYEKGVNNIFIHRVFVVGNRWYEAIAVYEAFYNESFNLSYTRNSLSINKFFDSLQIQR